MRIAFDSNVLLYAEGLNDPGRQRAARALVAGLVRCEIVIPLQVLGETFSVLRRKLSMSAQDTALAIARWSKLAAQRPETTEKIFTDAQNVATSHHLQIWDAIILAASAQAHCELLLSEDLQDGFVWRGVTVANPFATSPHPLLADALNH